MKPSYTNSSLLYKIKKCGYFQDAHTQWRHRGRCSSYFLHYTIDAPIGSSRVYHLDVTLTSHHGRWQWISNQLSGSHWQWIQNSAPSTIVWHQCDIQINNWLPSCLLYIFRSLALSCSKSVSWCSLLAHLLSCSSDWACKVFHAESFLTTYQIADHECLWVDWAVLSGFAIVIFSSSCTIQRNYCMSWTEFIWNLSVWIEVQIYRSMLIVLTICDIGVTLSDTLLPSQISSTYFCYT
jgi:hypothetical protein